MKEKLKRRKKFRPKDANEFPLSNSHSKIFLQNNSEEDEEKDEETPPRRTKKSKRSVEPAPKKAKKSALQKKGLSQFLGKRKSAAEASEKIKTFVGAEIEGHSSGSEEGQNSKADKKAESSASGERQSSRLRTRTSKSQINMESKAAKLKEQRLSSDDFMAFKVSKSRCKRRRGKDLKKVFQYFLSGGKTTCFYRGWH